MEVDDDGKSKTHRVKVIRPSLEPMATFPFWSSLSWYSHFPPLRLLHRCLMREGINALAGAYSSVHIERETDNACDSREVLVQGKKCSAVL